MSETVRQTASLRLHRHADMIPEMSQDVFDAFCADVKEHGLKNPIDVLDDGTVLDGRHRLRAAKANGLHRVPVRVVDLGGEDSVEYMVRAAVQRRDLTADQKGAIFLALSGYREKRDAAAKAKAEGPKKGGEAKAARAVTAPVLSGNVAGKQTPPAHVPAARRVAAERETRTALAAEAGISPRTMQKAITVARLAESNPRVAALVPKIKAGECSADDAIKLAKLEAKHALAEELRAEPLPMVSGPFRVIVADPPWRYEKRAEDISHRGRNPYPDMSVDEICALPVRELAVDDAVLWLWTTNAFMRDAFRVLDAWGFTERTILTWVKDRMGTGDWLRGKSEHCILAIRGRPIVTLTNETTVLAAPLREHSRKPDEFFALVDKLCPGTKVELFAREPREGWAAWGAEKEKFDAAG